MAARCRPRPSPHPSQLPERVERHRSALAPRSLSVLEHDHGRDVANVERLRRSRGSVRVELCDQQLALVLRRELVHRWRHHFAWPTPISVEVHHHRYLALRDGAPERVVGERERSIDEHRLAALTTLGAIGGALRDDAVPRLAELTANRDAMPGGFRFGLGCPRHVGSLTDGWSDIFTPGRFWRKQRTAGRMPRSTGESEQGARTGTDDAEGR